MLVDTGAFADGGGADRSEGEQAGAVGYSGADDPVYAPDHVRDVSDLGGAGLDAGDAAADACELAVQALLYLGGQRLARGGETGERVSGGECQWHDPR
jgi:hypothetical protein